MRRRACRISRPRRSPPVDFSLCVRSWRQLHAYGPWDADSDVLECRPMTVVTAGLHGLLRCTSSVASVQSPDRGVLASLSSIPVGPFISIFVYVTCRRSLSSMVDGDYDASYTVGLSARCFCGVLPQKPRRRPDQPQWLKWGAVQV